ncbi:MAG: hypothetical protein ACYDCI_00390 [Candidatus Limnocylindrales bacterium]
MSLSLPATSANPDRPRVARPPTTGDVLNALINALESLEYEVVEGSVADDGLAAIGHDGRIVRIDLDYRLAAAMPCGPSIDRTAPDILRGIARAMQSYDDARRYA